MDKSLELLQLVDQALVLLGGALLLFAISSEERSAPFKEAMEEFRRLKRIFPKLRLARSQMSSDAYMATPVFQIVKDECERAHVATSSLQFSSEEEMLQFAPPHYAANDPQLIDDLYNYVKTAKFDHFNLYRFDLAALREEVRDLLQKEAFTTVTTVMIGRAKDPDLNPVPGKCMIGIIGENPEGKEVGVFTEDEKGVPCAIDRTQPYSDAVEMLKEHHVVEESEGYSIPFPALTRVWDALKGHDMSVVEGILVRKSTAEAQEIEDKLEILGLSFRRSAVVLGPFVQVSLLFFMFALVLHIASIKISDLATVKQAPVFGLLLNWPGKIVTVSTILILPALSSGYLVFQFLRHSRWRVLATIIFAFVSILLSIAILNQIFRIVTG